MRSSCQTEVVSLSQREAVTSFLNRRTTTLLYLGIDQHARQLTISLRDDAGDVLQARQVSTRTEKIQEFFTKITLERLRSGESFIALVVVCGFSVWLIRQLRTPL
jgi:activator of 2-hydroxyglutaryl-CoA dehydratase